MERIASLIQTDLYHVPCVCEKCGGVMIFQGIGEYHCEDCGTVAFDDYGKIRGYIEEHRGANAMEIENAVGVSQRTIRQLLREVRLEVAEGSRTFLHCELCGKPVRSGKFCPDCETKAHRSLEEKQREMLNKVKNMQGFGLNETGDEGQKRFVRDNG